MARKSKNPIALSTVFNSTSGTLAQIRQKTNSLNNIADIVRQTCPDLPVQSWHIGNISDNTVTIEVISSVWGQRLQFEKNKISAQLSQLTDGVVTHVAIKVNPYFNRQKPSKQAQDSEKPRKQMSQKSADQLKEVAANAPKSLQEKLLRLAEHVNKN